MGKTWLPAIFALVALLWLCAPAPSSAWSLAPEHGSGGAFAAQQSDGGLPDNQVAPERETHSSRGFGMQIIPLILIIPLGWLFFRSIARRGRDQDEEGRPDSPSGPDVHTRDEDPQNLQEAYRRARAQWEWMTSEPTAGPKSVEKPSGVEPGGFDKAEFLRGAKLVYSRLTEAFDKLDVEAAAPFAGEAVLEGLRARTASGARPASTEIVLVEAELLEHAKKEDSEEAVVLYDALVRRGPDAAEPEQLKQVWRFSRDPRDPSSMWRLERMEPYSDPVS
ncbi:TIM44-like domain-containing protein [Paucidesulfovibrio longus]|uniref:TIM44-like domain-containing protein n=1 Tax=Paucidesulfovibrio longus TaxID=889 RepID=UPI0003B4D79F|nr:TIM44-like domain-containing protein [Paucidesulfovibrio longus]